MRCGSTGGRLRNNPESEPLLRSIHANDLARALSLRFGSSGFSADAIHGKQLAELAAEQHRSRGTPDRIRSQIREHVEWLNRQIDELDHEIGQRVRSSPAWRDRDDLFRSTPGLPVLSATL